jgi:hypothetical protein
MGIYNEYELCTFVYGSALMMVRWIWILCLLVEGYGSVSVQNSDESGSGRPQNIRIHNTGYDPGPESEWQELQSGF